MFIALLTARVASQVLDLSAICAETPDLLLQAQAYSWGIDRIDQTALPLDGTYHARGDGAGVAVFVLDTGCAPPCVYTCCTSPYTSHGYNPIARAPRGVRTKFRLVSGLVCCGPLRAEPVRGWCMCFGAYEGAWPRGYPSHRESAARDRAAESPSPLLICGRCRPSFPLSLSSLTVTLACTLSLSFIGKA